MRYTLHLVTARDYLALRPVFAPLLAQRFRGSPFRRNLVDVDLESSAGWRGTLIEERPRTRGRARPAACRALARAGTPCRCRPPSATCVPLVQVPPRGVWGAGGLPTWGLAETWLGATVGTDPAPDDLVLRYLAAFGPAAVADIGNWSGLTRLGPVVERLRNRLVVVRDERNRELFDIPDAPRPGPDVPAPVRFLPEYDNVLLGHKDRTRMMDVDQATPLFPGNGAALGSVLVDGRFGGGWRIVREGTTAILQIELVAAPSESDRRELLEEGDRLLEFVTDGGETSGRRDVLITSPD